MGQVKIRASLIIIVLLVSGVACQLTSPTPASWSGTPTAEARAVTNTIIALTQEAALGDVLISTPTETPILETERTPTPQTDIKPDGPWLVYTAPEGGALHAYDVATNTIIEISLPEPIFSEDLVSGLSPDGHTLIVRAGSAYNTDELALYQIDLPSTDVIKRSPLLSIALQRKIVNQEGSRAMETLQAVTQKDGLAWSPDGRFLAFNAALDNESSDLYVLDTLNNRLDRLNGLYSHNASPFWAPNSTWLVSQELGNYDPEKGWRSEIVTGLRVPSFDHQNTLYLSHPESLREVFLGWINAHHFISHSLTADGPKTLKQVNVEDQAVHIIFEGLFDLAAFDPVTRSLAFSLGYEKATPRDMVGGVYLFGADHFTFNLQRAGDWKQLSYDPGGMFVVAGSQGAYTFTSEGEGLFLPDQGNVRLSSQGNWMIAYGDGVNSAAGARLYQPSSNHPLQTLIEDRVEVVLWQPDSSAFFIQSEGIIYHLAFPSLNLQEVAGGFPTETPLDLIWVE